MIGSPVAIDLIATLWPAGIRSTVVTPSTTTIPGGRLERAISTPSSGCRRMTGAGAMGFLLSLQFASPRESGERQRIDLRLPAGILAGRIDLHFGVGRHQADLVGQRHQLEAHVDGARRAFGAAAMDSRVELAFVALLHDLLVDLE